MVLQILSARVEGPSMLRTKSQFDFGVAVLPLLSKYLGSRTYPRLPFRFAARLFCLEMQQVLAGRR